MHNHRQNADHDFSNRAAAYDKGIEGWASKPYYNLVLNHAQLPNGARVLDVGCGTGALLRMLNERHPIAGFGIDAEPGMIEQAHRQCPEMDIRLGRCGQLPFEANSFDALITCMAYHHFSDKPAFAKEAARVLKPGGVLYISDVRFPDLIRFCLSGLLRHMGATDAFHTPEQIGQTFAECGLQLDGDVQRGLAQLVILKRDARCFPCTSINF